MNALSNVIIPQLRENQEVLGLGWKCVHEKSCNKKEKNSESDVSNSADEEDYCPKYSKALFCYSSQIGFLKLLGIFITAIMTSLGAPFGFDLLNKLIKLRGSGVSHERGI